MLVSFVRRPDDRRPGPAPPVRGLVVAVLRSLQVVPVPSPAPTPATGAIVLAGGAGTRFGGPGHKLLVPLAGGTTVLGRAVGAAVESAIGPVAVVLGAVGVEDVSLPAGVMVLVNDRWSEGQAGSLQVGLSWARERAMEAVVVGLGDQPGLTPVAWRQVAAATSTPIAVATYDGRRGHPTRLAASIWPQLPTAGDRGARGLLTAQAELVTEVACAGEPADIDTVADLRRWRAQEAVPSHGGPASR